MPTNNTHLLINCDMGEWDAPHLASLDHLIMPHVDLSNIACGGHAGSEEIIKKTISIALENNVRVGAHPGYEDRANFGRTYVPMNQNELSSLLKKQIDLFLSICSDQNVLPYHIKTHGALYHACNQLDMESRVLIDVVKELCPKVSILAAPKSKLEKAVKKEGLKTLPESFIDRRYNDDLTLVGRSEEDAVIFEIDIAKNQFLSLSNGEVLTKSGKKVSLHSSTACIHGDNQNCLTILEAIRHHG